MKPVVFVAAVLVLFSCGTEDLDATGLESVEEEAISAGPKTPRCFEHAFADALITEVTCPKLDGASKDAASLK